MGITRDRCDLCFTFNFIRCNFFFGVFRSLPLWFCHSWSWSHTIFFVLTKEIRFDLKLASTGKWASEHGIWRPVVLLSRDSLLFQSWNIWGVLTRRGKHFLSMWFSAKAYVKHWMRVNTSKRSITNLFLYFCHDLSIEALLCTWKCILSM